MRARSASIIAILPMVFGQVACTQSHGGADDADRDGGVIPLPDLSHPRDPADLAPAALALNLVTPPEGPPSGGITLSLDGQAFQSGAVVSIDGKSAAPVQFMTSQKLSAVLPQSPDAFGAVPVTVTLPGGATVTRKDLFAYVAQTLSFAGRPFGLGENPNALFAGDFDLDGQDDMAAATFGPTPRVFICMNSPTKICDRGMGAYYAGLPVSLVFGDFNSDGKGDVVVSTVESVKPEERELHTFLNDGMGGFLPEVLTPLSSNIGKLIAVDMNGDKKLDLVGACNTYDVCVMPGDGTGKFGGGVSFRAGMAASPVVADLDGDGNKDLAMAAVGSLQILVALSDGKGNYTKQLMAPVKVGATALAVGDVDRDGVPDLITAHRDGGLLSVLRGLGGGAFSTAIELNVGGAPDFVQLADFNGDAKRDIAFSDSKARTISIMLGDGKGGFATPAAQPGGIGPVNLVVGDFNKDRRPDLLAEQLGAMVDLTLLMNTSR